MGHNSFIKGSITHVSPGFSRVTPLETAFRLGWSRRRLHLRGHAGPTGSRGCDGGVRGGFAQLPPSVLQQQVSSRTELIAGWRVQGREKKKVAIPRHNVNVHPVTRHGRKKVCAITPAVDMRAPIYNNVYHNWRGLCSNCMKPPSTPNPPGPSPHQNLNIQAGGP